MRLEALLRGLVAGFVAALTATGLFTVLHPEPSPTVQYLQIAHYLIGHAVLPFGLLYVVVHLWQTWDRAGLVRRVRATGRALFSWNGLRWLLAGALILAVVVGGISTFGLSTYEAFGALGLERESVAFTTKAIAVLVSVATVGGLVVLYALRRYGLNALTVRWLLLASVASSALNGLYMATGLKTRAAPVDPFWLLHVLSSLFAIVLCVLHVLTSRRVTARRSSAAPRVYRWKRPMLLGGLPVGLGLLGLASLFAIRGAADTRPLEVDRSLLVPTDVGFTEIAPAACIECHRPVSEGWASSSHAHAASNPFFTELLRQSYDEGGPEMAAFCLGCHAPHAADPRRHSFDEVVESPGYGAGVHCVSCHRSEPGEGHGDGGLVVRPLAEDPSAFLMERTGPRGEEFRASYSAYVLISSRLALHRRTYRFQSHRPEACMPCHVQTLTVPTGGHLETVLQDQYDSWLESPAAHAGRDCRACHMPAFRDEMLRRHTDHRMRAASTYVAAIGDGDAAVQETLDHLEGREARMPQSVLEGAGRGSGPLLVLDVTAAEEGRALELRSRNTGRIGHSFPNGPTDLLQVWLAVRAVDARGEVVLDLGAAGPEGAPRLGHSLLDREGAPVRDHRLWEVAEVIDAGQIPPQGDHVMVLPLGDGSPAWPLEVEAAWRYRRLDPAQVERVTGQRIEIPVATVASFAGSVSR